MRQVRLRHRGAHPAQVPRVRRRPHDCRREHGHARPASPRQHVRSAPRLDRPRGLRRPGVRHVRGHLRLPLLNSCRRLGKQSGLDHAALSQVRRLFPDPLHKLRELGRPLINSVDPRTDPQGCDDLHPSIRLDHREVQHCRSSRRGLARRSAHFGVHNRLLQGRGAGPQRYGDRRRSPGARHRPQGRIDVALHHALAAEPERVHRGRQRTSARPAPQRRHGKAAGQTKHCPCLRSARLRSSCGWSASS
jgi:hypothetical protein